MSPRPPPKISLKHDWKRELGSEVARQPEGEVVQQLKSSQSSQPNPNPDRSAKNAYHTGAKALSIAKCGHLLKEIAANRGVIQYTLDLLSSPNYVIKKGRPHGHRYGKIPEKKEYHQAYNLNKRCIKKHFKEIHDRFFERS